MQKRVRSYPRLKPSLLALPGMWRLLSVSGFNWSAHGWDWRSTILLQSGSIMRKPR